MPSTVNVARSTGGLALIHIPYHEVDQYTAVLCAEHLLGVMYKQRRSHDEDGFYRTGEGKIEQIAAAATGNVRSAPERSNLVMDGESLRIENEETALREESLYLFLLQETSGRVRSPRDVDPRWRHTLADDAVTHDFPQTKSRRRDIFLYLKGLRRYYQIPAQYGLVNEYQIFMTYANSKKQHSYIVFIWFGTYYLQALRRQIELYVSKTPRPAQKIPYDVSEPVDMFIVQIQNVIPYLPVHRGVGKSGLERPSPLMGNEAPVLTAFPGRVEAVIQNRAAASYHPARVTNAVIQPRDRHPWEQDLVQQSIALERHADRTLNGHIDLTDAGQSARCRTLGRCDEASDARQPGRAGRHDLVESGCAARECLGIQLGLIEIRTLSDVGFFRAVLGQAEARLPE